MFSSMYKKFTALACLAALMIAFAACGNNQEQPQIIPATNVSVEAVTPTVEPPQQPPAIQEAGLPLIFSRYAPQAQQAVAPSDEWVTVNNIITIPSTWHYDTWSGIEILGEGADGTPVDMQVVWADAYMVQELWEEAFMADDVFFDDGSIGVYFMLPFGHAWAESIQQ